MSNLVKDFRNSLNEILKIDPNATYEVEDCGSGTISLNIYFSKKSIKHLTLEKLDKLEKFDVSGDDEGDTIKTRLLDGDHLFICLA